MVAKRSTPQIYALPDDAAAPSIEKKFCPCCLKERPLAAFAVDRRYSGGRRWHCVQCQPTGRRPKLRYCPMCQERREETLFPVEQHEHHPAGRVQRRWYCIVGQELHPHYEEIHELELSKRQLYQIQREINATAEEEKRLLHSREERTSAFRDLLRGIRRKLEDLWSLLRKTQARLLAEASDLELLLYGRYSPASLALYGPPKRRIDAGWQTAA